LPKLKPKQMERLTPYLYRKETRQRIILYLLGVGYSVPELVRMKISDLKKLEFSDEMLGFRDELIETAECEKAFCYPNGKPMAHNDFYTLLRRLDNPEKGKRFSQTSFRKYIQTGSQ